MRKYIAILGIVALFASCDKTNTGNKSVLPVTHEEHADGHHGEGHGEDHASSEEEAAPAVASTDISAKVGLTFEAFKTPAKKGVKGQFENMTVTAPNVSASTAQEKLTDASFSIATNSVKTGDDSRDNTLRNEFFAKLAGETISGKVVEVSEGSAKIALTLNGKEVTKDFEYFGSDANPNSVLLKGKIDMLADFAAETAFNSIAKACEALHEGKTWTDVNLEVQIDF